MKVTRTRQGWSCSGRYGCCSAGGGGPLRAVLAYLAWRRRARRPDAVMRSHP